MNAGFLLEVRSAFLAISNVLPILAFAGRISAARPLASHSGIPNETRSLVQN